MTWGHPLLFFPLRGSLSCTSFYIFTTTPYSYICDANNRHKLCTIFCFFTYIYLKILTILFYFSTFHMSESILRGKCTATTYTNKGTKLSNVQLSVYLHK